MTIGFSKTFGFDRQSLSRLLCKYAENPAISAEDIMKLLGVGKQKQEAMVAWMKYLGLRNNESRELTPLGITISRHDPYMEKIGTQFILHYQLASNPAAEVWYNLTNKFLPAQTQFSYDDALNHLVSMNLASRESKHLKADLRIYISSLSKAEALGRLGIIKKNTSLGRREARDQYQVCRPSTIPPFAVGFGLYSFRDKHSPKARTVSVRDAIIADGNVGKVFMLTRERLSEILNVLSGIESGHSIHLTKAADVDHVELLFDGNAAEFLQMYYPRME